MLHVVSALFSAAVLAACLHLISSTIRDHAGRISDALMPPPEAIGQADLHRSQPDRHRPTRPERIGETLPPEVATRILIDA